MSRVPRVSRVSRVPRAVRGLSLDRAAWPVDRAGSPLAAGIIGGAALDAAFGDPRRGHPVALFGRAAQAWQDRVYADSVARGAGYTACCVAAAGSVGLVAQRLTRGRPLAGLAVTAAAAWMVSGAASLAAQALRIQRALEAGDLRAARAALPSLCGRDPDGLDEFQIARAVVESVAENASDAIIAPLLWGALAGLPGFLAYRAVNTLDAMIGYRSLRYAKFGRAAARLDDVLNWAPARLTALGAVAMAAVAGGRPGPAWRTLRTYGGRHPSPNAGRCEAAFAGALGVRLGGPNIYGGITETRPTLGGGRPAVPADISRAVRLCRAITLAATAAAAVLALLAGGGQGRSHAGRSRAGPGGRGSQPSWPGNAGRSGRHRPEPCRIPDSRC